MKTSLFIIVISFVFGTVTSCGPGSQQTTPATASDISINPTQAQYWQNLKQLCGNAYEGEIVAGGENDTLFGGKRLIMHVRACEENRIRIPFFVGADSSRTWVLTLSHEGILLKHDHRHRDGTDDEITMYGGLTSNFGSAYRQFFPADQETADMLPEAIGNIWWIDVVPGEHFTYNLRRVNTPRLFSVRFDLSAKIDIPGAPWGWED